MISYIILESGVQYFIFVLMCSGHFGYIELPIPIYHPSHVSELKRLLSLLCLKCLKMKTNKVLSDFTFLHLSFSSLILTRAEIVC